MSKKRHRTEHHEEHADETWLIPYADLLTLLLALFIVLYAMNSVDSKKFEEMSKAFSIAFNSGVGVLDNTTIVETGQQMSKENNDKRNPSDDGQKEEEEKAEKERKALMQQEQEDLEKLKKQIDQYIQSKGLTTQLDTKLNQSQLMLTISDNALFPSGSATLKPESRSLAGAIANMLKQYPEYEIIVAGHTDDQPISNREFRNNWELSFQRAYNFMEILLNNSKHDPKLISPIGHGEYRPVDTNDTVLGRSKNRRVEVSIIRRYADPEKAQSITAASATKQ